MKAALRPSYKSGALSREEFKVARSVTEAAFARFGDGPKRRRRLAPRSNPL